MNNPALEEAQGRVRELLQSAPRTIVFEHDGEEMEVEVFPPDELEAGQVGYSLDGDGHSLVGSKGSWMPNWLVIGYETLLGDPIFVDLDDQALPVFTAMHGMGSWVPDPVASSLRTLLGISTGE